MSGHMAAHVQDSTLKVQQAFEQWIDFSSPATKLMFSKYSDKQNYSRKEKN
jgi:hypothetical protein